MGHVIAAFDVATATGCCDGDAAAFNPRFWTWDLRDAGEGRPRRLAYLRRFLDAYFDTYRPAEVIIEEPLPIVVASRVGSSDEVQLLLRGAIGVVEACAAFAGVPSRLVDIKDARKHLFGRYTMRGENPKPLTMRACRTLGWEVENDNEADAGALWSLAAAQHNPRLAGLTRAAHAGPAQAPPQGPDTKPRRPGRRGDPLLV